MANHNLNLSDQDAAAYSVAAQKCPGCHRVIVVLKLHMGRGSQERIVYPKAVARRTFSEDDIGESFLTDYTEACLVLTDSAKASAALSRRCVQNILREK